MQIALAIIENQEPSSGFLDGLYQFAIRLSILPNFLEVRVKVMGQSKVWAL